jgi:hypothetical protein
MIIMDAKEATQIAYSQNEQDERTRRDNERLIRETHEQKIEERACQLRINIDEQIGRAAASGLYFTEYAYTPLDPAGDTPTQVEYDEGGDNKEALDAVYDGLEEDGFILSFSGTNLSSFSDKDWDQFEYKLGIAWQPQSEKRKGLLGRFAARVARSK